ncbi:stage III sporulation protein AB [Lachnospiraceae bacterium 38-10]
MLRIFGIFVIMAGSSGCAYSIVRERGEYLERCRQWLELFELMENEIAFQKSSLPEICARSGSRLTGNKKLFLDRVGQAFVDGGDTLGEVWRREIRRILELEPLNGEVEKEVEELGERLCFEDGGMQRKMLSDMGRYLEKHLKEQESLNREKNKLTLCAGVMGGLLLTVLLL